MMRLSLSRILPVSAALCLMTSLGLGLWVQDASNPLMMLPAVLMSLWLIGSGRLLQLNLRDPALLGLSVLWVLWALSSLHSAFPFNSQVTWLIMGTLPISFMVWRAAAFEAPLLKIIMGLILGSGTLLAIWALLQVTVLPATPWNGRAGYPFADPNMLGIYFSLLILPLSAILLTQPLNSLLRTSFIVVLGLMLAGLCATQSRSAFLGMGMGMGLILILLRHKIIWTRNIQIALGAAALGITAVIASSGFISRFLSVFSEHGDKDVLSRLSLWQSAFTMSLQNPLLGYGFGTFGLYYPIFRQPADNSGGWWVHMDPLQWAVESGWATPIIFYALCAYLAFCVFRLARTKTITGLQAGSAGALLCLFLNAHTAYPLHVIPFMLLATSMMTVLVPVPETAPSSKLAPVFAFSILLALVFNQLTTLRVGSTLYYWQQISEARVSGDQYRFSTNMKDCLERGDPHYAFCKFLVIETALNAAQELPPMTLQLIDNARLYNPMLPQPDFYLGLYYLKTSPQNPIPAITAFEQSLAKNPTFWSARRLLVGTLSAAGRNKEALAVLEKGADYPATESEQKFYEYMRSKLQLALIGGE